MPVIPIHLTNEDDNYNSLTGVADVIYGLNGNDFIFGNEGNDRLFGGNGNDFVDGGQNSDQVYGGNGNDEVRGASGDDYVYGENGDDVVAGGPGNDEVYGGEGNDILFGDRGNLSTAGADKLTGGAGDDTFSYLAASESFGSTVDAITDFKWGCDADKIDLSLIDAGVLSFDNNLTPTDDPGVTAHHVTWYESGGNTIVQADVDGNNAVDFQITLLGTGLNLTAADFIL